MNAIVMKNISKTFGKKEVFKNIQFFVKKGDFTLIVGENGVGKSTLIKIILNDIKKDSGDIFIEKDFKNISYLSQRSTIEDDFPASCREILEMCFYFTKISKKEFLKKLKYYVDLFEVEDILNEAYKNLSLGQKGKILIIRSLISLENIIFVDEIPFVDEISRLKFYYELKRLNDKEKTIIFITHKQEELKPFCKKIIEIKDKSLNKIWEREIC